jgi:hypothetical protein
VFDRALRTSSFPNAARIVWILAFDHHLSVRPRLTCHLDLFVVHKNLLVASFTPPSLLVSINARAKSDTMSASSADVRPRPAETTKKVHIADTQITSQNWYKHVNWLNVTFILGIPMYGCIQALWVPLQLKTAVWAIAYYFITGLGITAGKSATEWTIQNVKLVY